METTIITCTCNRCHKTFDISVRTEDYHKYKNGALIQDAFPYLSVGDRELIISSICGKCFDELFSDWDNEDK